MLGLIAAAIGLVGTGVGIYFKFFRKTPSAAEQVQQVDRKMMQDENDRPTSINNAIDRL